MNGKGRKDGKKQYTPRDIFTFVLLGVVAVLIIIAVALAIVKGNKKPKETSSDTPQEKIVTQSKVPAQTRDPNKEPGDVDVDVNDLPD